MFSNNPITTDRVSSGNVYNNELRLTFSDRAQKKLLGVLSASIKNTSLLDRVQLHHQKGLHSKIVYDSFGSGLHLSRHHLSVSVYKKFNSSQSNTVAF